MTDAEIRASRREHKKMRERLRKLVRSGTPTRFGKGIESILCSGLFYVDDYATGHYAVWPPRSWGRAR